MTRTGNVCHGGGGCFRGHMVRAWRGKFSTAAAAVLLGVFGAAIPGTAAGAGKIYVINNTCEQLRIAVHFKERSTGRWRTEGDWTLDPGEKTRCLAVDGKCLRGEGDVIYFWAEGSNGWEFKGDLSIDGRKFKKIVDAGYLLIFNYDYDIKFGRKYDAGNCLQDGSVWIKLDREARLARDRCYHKCAYNAADCGLRNVQTSCSKVESACRQECDSENPRPPWPP